eukprot:TRINITY_DN37657_c0_g1_i1.p2 TRINITY_DN37657_c0_g1~~TRINITY_DN37657_c0_g1_i1.p2  ORF type:complete len:165 (+),score=16.72 TRINITY_DN37657_c0_g1_i1:36-530(+)
MPMAIVSQAALRLPYKASLPWAAGRPASAGASCRRPPSDVVAASATSPDRVRHGPLALGARPASAPAGTRRRLGTVSRIPPASAYTPVELARNPALARSSSAPSGGRRNNVPRCAKVAHNLNVALPGAAPWAEPRDAIPVRGASYMQMPKSFGSLKMVAPGFKF